VVTPDLLVVSNGVMVPHRMVVSDPVAVAHRMTMPLLTMRDGMMAMTHMVELGVDRAVVTSAGSRSEVRERRRRRRHIGWRRRPLLGCRLLFSRRWQWGNRLIRDRLLSRRRLIRHGLLCGGRETPKREGEPRPHQLRTSHELPPLAWLWRKALPI